MAPHYAKPVILTILTVAVGYTLASNFSSAPAPPNPERNNSLSTVPTEASTSASSNGVSALGYIKPLGDVIELAAPTQGYNMQPLVASINVVEGESIVKGQVLAVFDTFERLKTQEASALELIRSLQDQLKIVAYEAGRYRVLASEGAAPASEKNQRELTLLELKSKLVETRAELRRIKDDKRYSVLVSPINGTVLKILSNPGERVMPYGVMKVGQTDSMGAVVQVYESYIGRANLNGAVTIRSENGSFPGTITGRIIHIASIVGERQKLSLDPASDSDKESRTFAVEIAIDPTFNRQVMNLIGAKVVARF